MLQSYNKVPRTILVLFLAKTQRSQRAYGGAYPFAFFAPLREIFSVPRRSLVGISGIAKRSLRCSRTVFFSRQDAKIAKGLWRCISLCVLCAFARDIFRAQAFFGGNLRHSETKSPVSSRCFLFSPRRKDRKETYGGAYPFAFFARDIFHSL